MENPDHVQKGVQRVTFNGTAVQDNILTDDLVRSCNQAEVVVTMG